MSFNPTGRAEVDPSSPRAFAVCDRCGRWYNHNVLQWQYEWAGAQLINVGALVCSDCLDVPQIQLKTIILPQDPEPVLNARIEPFSLDEDPPAPTLFWTSGDTVAEAVFTIDFEQVIEGDVITVEIADDDLFVDVIQTLTHTLTAAEAIAGTIDETAAALSSGTYYARAKITGTETRLPDMWSDTVSKTLTIGPTTGRAMGMLLALTYPT